MYNLNKKRKKNKGKIIEKINKEKRTKVEEFKNELCLEFWHTNYILNMEGCCKKKGNLKT